MGDELKWLLKEGVCIFLKTLSLENKLTPFESRPIQVLKNPDL